MTVLPFLDIKATPIHSIELPHSSRAQSLSRVTESNSSSRSSHHSNKLLPPSSLVGSSVSSGSTRTPKIKITSRTDEILKKLPYAKPAGGFKHNFIWKPLTRELPDYDYVWEPLQREDIRHQYDIYSPPERITASRPDGSGRMTTSFETEDRHFQNYKRVRGMKQRQWNKEHIQYTIYPYSPMIEREMYNKHIRSTLKEQMKEKVQTDKHEQEMRNLECRIVIQRDRQDLEQEKQKQNQRARALLQVTTRNKELIENKREYDQWNRAHQWHVDRAILADDPINWSKTMT